MPRADFRFSTFEVDLQGGELYKRGVRIALQEQPFRLLRTLLERAGELVTREELYQQLWPDGTFVDFDRGLNTAVNRLREALSDTAGSPRFIETVPRRGYRFIGEVQDLRPRPGASEHVEAPRREQRRIRAFIAAAALFGIFVLSGAAWYVARIDDTSQPAIRTTQLTSYSGNEREPSFSPDGSQVALSWDNGQIGKAQIYVKQLRSERLLRLTSGDADHRSPAWSPDGRWIAFLVEFPVPWSASTGDLRPPVGCLAWSPDSKWLAVSERKSGTTGLSLISLESGAKRDLTSPTAEWLGDFSPAFSPDGQKLAFIRSNAGMSLSEIYMLSLDGNLEPAAKPTQLTAQNCWIANPVWLKNSEEIAFSCGQWGTGRRLFRAPIAAAQKPVMAGSVADDIYSIAISHSSGRLIYPASGEGERFLSSTRVETNPQYAPDGMRIAFESSRSGNSQIWIADADGSNAFQVTSVQAPVNGFPRWSPDGKRIAFHSRPAVHANIFVIDASGGAARQLTHGASGDIAPAWSQDGRWIYFCSRRSGDSEIWKMPAGGGSAVQITKRGGLTPQEAGRFLWYTKNEGRNASLWKSALGGGPEIRVVDGLANLSTYSVTQAGVYLIARDQGGHFSVQHLGFGPGEITRLGPIGGIPVLGLTVSPDRRWLLYNRMDRRESDLMLVENFDY